MSAFSPLLASPGAVPGLGRDSAVAAHYGDPLREQQTLASGGAFVDLSHRAVTAVGGPERLSWLHALTSQQLADLPAGQGIQALILSPHGHVEHHLHLVDDGERTWLHGEPGTGQALRDYLNAMRFRTKVEVSDGSAQRVVVWTPVSGHDLIDPAELRPRADHAALAGMLAYEAFRIADGVPRLGVDTDERTIPHEVGWLGVAVHLAKGCYRGQETVARVHNLGRPPRRLIRLHLDGSRETFPPPGTAVHLGTERMGFLGTAAHHFELGPIALALVARGVPDGADLLVDTGGGDPMVGRVDPLPGLSYDELAEPKPRPGAELRSAGRRLGLRGV